MKRDENLTLEEQVERVRRKRAHYGNHDKLRAILNCIFLLLAAIGLVMYFFFEKKEGSALNASHATSLCIIGAGMLCKVVEFLIRFFL